MLSQYNRANNRMKTDKWHNYNVTIVVLPAPFYSHGGVDKVSKSQPVWNPDHNYDTSLKIFHANEAYTGIPTSSPIVFFPVISFLSLYRWVSNALTSLLVLRWRPWAAVITYFPNL